MPRLLLSGELHPNLATHGRVLARGQAGRRLRVRLPCGCVYPVTISPAFTARWATFRLDALPASMRCSACRGGVAAPRAPPASPSELRYANAEHFEDFMARFESGSQFSRSSTRLVLPTWSARVKRVVFDDPDARWERAKAKAVLRAMRVDYYVGWYEHPCPHTLQALLAQEARNFHGEAVPPCARWQLVRLADDV